MARKNILSGLMEAPAPQPDAAAPAARLDPERPRARGGAIGAVSKSIADLKARAIVEVDPRMIDGAGLRDRLDEDADLPGLIASIRDYGQQVPVLLRVNPNDPERYQVVYGRRRVAALKALNRPVRAMVRDLDDRALVVAQGQENSARKDLSFIERANFARQMRDAGYDRRVICDALSVDKTLVSRMLSVIDRIPLPLLEAIGAAPGFGRDRWNKLAEAAAGGADLLPHAVGETSDERLQSVLNALARPAPARPAPRDIEGEDGPIAQARPKGRRVELLIEDPGFADWLADALPEIHRDWRSRRDVHPPQQKDA